MEKNYFNKSSYQKLPKIQGSNTSELDFKDNNMRDQRLDTNDILTELDNPSLLYQTGNLHITDRLETKLTEAHDKHNSKVTYEGASKSTADEFFNTNNSFRPRKFGTSRSTVKLQQTTTKFRDLKTRMTPEYSVNDFYLKSLFQTRQSDFDIIKKTSSSRLMNTQVSLVESNSHSRSTLNLETKRTTSTAKQVFGELQKMSEGKVIKQKFYDNLTPNLREFYAPKKDFGRIFDDVDMAMYCMDEVIQRVKCYRAELGVLMEKTAYCFRKIMEKLLDTSMKMDNERQRTFDRTMEENRQGLEKLAVEKRMLEDKLKQYRQLMDIRDSEASLYQFNVSSLENETKMLHELLKKEYLVENKIDTMEDLKRKQDIENAKKMVEPSVALNDNLIDLQDTVKDLEEVQDQKSDLLKEMNNLLKAMLKGGKKDQITQVEEGDLAWTTKNIYRDEQRKPKQRDMEQLKVGSVNIEGTIQDTLEQKGKIEGVDPLQYMALQDKNDDSEEIQETGTQSPGKLHGKVMTITDAHNIAQTIADNWNLPLPMILFLDNVTKNKEMANVLPWQFFKKQIYEIYVDRLHNSLELSNSLVTTWVPMSEYTCIYFLKTYKLRRMAEMKMMEFLVSLRYYIKHWPRALMYANLCQITHMKLEQNMTKITLVDELDPYAQYFYLHAFSKVYAQQEFIFDHPEGVSYLLKDKIEGVTDEVLVFESEVTKKKFFNGLQKHLRFYNDGTVDKEGIDIDRLLQWYIDIYFDARARNLQHIQKSFYKNQISNENVLSLEDVSYYVSDVIDQDSPIPGFIYPKDMNVARAFLYALTTGKNTFAVTLENLLAGLTRFGIDCPIPFINISGVKPSTANLELFGLDDSKSQLKKALTIGIKKSKVSSSNNKGPNLPFLKSENKREEEVGASSFKQMAHDSKEIKRKDEGKAIKIDSSSALFAQHFGIIRELRMFCIQMKENMRREQDGDVLRKNFEQILQVLDAGCQFLAYPVTL